ncbi:MAG TPA: 1-deoxy-D-xylulose-5-phosphate synthase [Acidimicrobiia bacterium]|nr:1-deoxy-D-xylulose-5-phosphate synthase [Acidimicrobiia bacterium]
MEPILESISDPSDLRSLSLEELEALSEEIRTFILDKVSKTGGHLSPNLGVVELTIALHRVFESPRDRLIWDVGHQAYVHKILTGRTDRFDTLRHTGGLSGYPSREESDHDFVENSHASTSLSYALGHALGGYEGWTVPIIGDGAFTGGMAYEALNHIAVAKPERMIIILNDNGRSYAPTVGGLAALTNLAHYRIDPRYEKAKHAIGRILRGIPLVGETADEMAGRMKDAVKQILEPATVFDALDLKYSGAIDGHDLALLEETLERAKTYHEPVVVHVITEKGNGYTPAIEDEEEKLHGVGAFDVATGRAHKSELKLTDVAGRAVAEAAVTRPDLVGVSAAMVSSSGLREMSRRFPDRVFDTGIAEQHTVTLAAGMAMAGKRPVVAIYSSFLQRAFDQIVTDVAMHDLPVTFLIDRAGITGPDGPSHHGVFDLSYLRMIPNMVIGAPADATELCAMIETAVDHEGPIAIRYPKGGAVSVPSLPVEPLEVGRAELLNEGGDVLLVAVGRMVEVAQKAAVDLGEKGVSAGVVDARWVKPLDPRILEWSALAPLVVTLEDNVMAGGFGAAVMESFAAAGLAKEVINVGVPDGFLPFGSASDVMESVGMDPDSVVERVLLAVGRRDS